MNDWSDRNEMGCSDVASNSSLQSHVRPSTMPFSCKYNIFTLMLKQAEIDQDRRNYLWTIDRRDRQDIQIDKIEKIERDRQNGLDRQDKQGRKNRQPK